MVPPPSCSSSKGVSAPAREAGDGIPSVASGQAIRRPGATGISGGRARVTTAAHRAST
ncbi:hypothetical protein Sya03_34840 [Spirilliplanes yamanashiensis]|uniref:Uncharacterized protein n=1 Tax=Spirilliplanes yamanashiensis TaxID=42233 RepID=A0A8J3YA27_9ACTN|nr:hypothetical protein Sya03_34840 [Spirilliplanes yamanashiensis]